MLKHLEGFKWRSDKFRFYGKFKQYYDKDSGKGRIIEVDVVYPKLLDQLHSDLAFL